MTCKRCSCRYGLSFHTSNLSSAQSSARLNKRDHILLISWSKGELICHFSRFAFLLGYVGLWHKRSHSQRSKPWRPWSCESSAWAMTLAASMWMIACWGVSSWGWFGRCYQLSSFAFRDIWQFVVQHVVHLKVYRWLLFFGIPAVILWKVSHTFGHRSDLDYCNKGKEASSPWILDGTLVGRTFISQFSRVRSLHLFSFFWKGTMFGNGRHPDVSFLRKLCWCSWNCSIRCNLRADSC